MGLQRQFTLSLQLIKPNCLAILLLCSTTVSLQTYPLYSRKDSLIKNSCPHLAWFVAAAYSLQPAAFSQQPAANSLSTTYSLQPTAYSLQPTAHSPQPAAYSLQPTAFSLQPTAYSLQSIACSLQPTDVSHIILSYLVHQS